MRRGAGPTRARKGLFGLSYCVYASASACNAAWTRGRRTGRWSGLGWCRLRGRSASSSCAVSVRPLCHECLACRSCAPPGRCSAQPLCYGCTEPGVPHPAGPAQLGRGNVYAPAAVDFAAFHDLLQNGFLPQVRDMLRDEVNHVVRSEVQEAVKHVVRDEVKGAVRMISLL